jgi:hypothetical protein
MLFLFHRPNFIFLIKQTRMTSALVQMEWALLRLSKVPSNYISLSAGGSAGGLFEIVGIRREVSNITKRKSAFKVGDRVNVRRGGTVYVITKLDGFACWIREEGFAPNGKPFADQRSDTSMLDWNDPHKNMHVAVINAGKVTEGPDLLARLFPFRARR